jgi:hypothetical protein
MPTHGVNVVALSGRRVDAVGETHPRFPLECVPMVRERIREVLKRTRARVLVCSAAGGADLLAMEVARELGLSVRVILPAPRRKFRKTSVVDRPGDWGEVFDRQMDLAEQEGAIHRMKPVTTSDYDGYLKALKVILDQAAGCANLTRKGEAAGVPGRVTALVVWDGQSRGEQDVTAAFLQQARDRSLSVREVVTRK